MKILGIIVGVWLIAMLVVALMMAFAVEAKPFPFKSLAHATLHGAYFVERGNCGTPEAPILGTRYDTGDGTGWVMYIFPSAGHWIAIWYESLTPISHSYGTMMRGMKDPVTFAITYDSIRGVRNETPCDFIEKAVADEQA